MKDCFLEVKTEWIGVRMEQEEEGKINLDLLGEFSVLFLRKMIFSSLGNIKLALVGVPSRRHVIRETVFRVLDLTPLPYVQKEYTK